MKSRYIIAVISGLFLLSSCEQEKPKFQISEVEYSPIYAKALPDSLKPPIITPINGNNAPVKISGVTKETIPLKHPNGVGVPTVTSYGVADGLSSNSVQDLVVGQDGMLWIGGIGNLSSFDGSAFVNYGSTLGAGDLFVSQLLIDTRGQLWVGSFNELFKFDGINLEPVILGSDNEDLYLWCLIEDSDGAIWAGTDHGLFRIIGDSISNFRIDGHEEERIFKLILSKEGNVIASTSEGLFQFDGAKLKPLNFLGKEYTPGYWEVFLDSQENYWFSLFENGKYKIGKFDGKDFTPIIEDASLYGSAFEDSSGKIWLPTSENIYVYDGVNLVQYSYDELGVDQFFSIVEDDTGNIWGGSFNGLHKISTGYMNLLEIPGTSSNFNLALTIDDQGVKWIASSGHQLIRYALNEIVVYDLSEYLAQEKGFIYEIYADKSGNIWMTTGGPQDQPREIIKFDGKEFYWYDPSEGLNLTFTRQIDDGRAGTLYFSGSGGLTTFDGEAFTHYGASQGFPESTGKVLLTSDGKLWVGTDTSGVFCFWEDSLIKMDTKNGLPANFINSIAEGPEGNIWIGTDGGLSKFDGKELKNYTEADGLSNLVSTIAVDHDRKLIWLLTVTGLAILPFDQINESKPIFTVYSQRNGFEMISGIFTRSKIFFDSSGVWAQGLGIIYRLDHDKVQNFPSPVLKIKNIRIDNQEVLWSLISDNPSEDSLTVMNESVLKLGKRINENNVESQFSSFGKISYDRLQNENQIPLDLSLPYFNNDITFEFTAISPSFGKHTRFRYKLDGYDKNWSPYSTKNEAHFGNMSEGSYTFNLEAISAYGSEGNLSYSFVVRPPWWRTWWAYAFYIILLLLLARRVHLLQKARTIRKERARIQAKELAQAKEIEKAYKELKSTQAQLIQSEKMASLGELTAGIAHEIQNPLNFVNNFSELSNELMDEMTDEFKEGDNDEGFAIADDIKQNLAKITHHGKRADAIVKGMLAHSRSGKGEKSPTDLNALAEEYLKLSYHGLRAKDNTFNADFKTDFDPNLPKVNVVPQDIGRVLLNLVNNAFQACAQSGTENPLVTVKTERTTSDELRITITDNGPGIPDEIKDKIFQPFFTTKPTGQGTGLGLSLSYDIVKAHGGDLSVVTKVNEGSEFVISLPTD